MRKSLILTGALIVLLAIPAAAQQSPEGPPTRIRGTVEKLDGQALTVKTREGQQVKVTVPPNQSVAYLVKKNLADIKSGDFVATTSMKGTDGKNLRSNCASSRSRCAAWAKGNMPGTLCPTA